MLKTTILIFNNKKIYLVKCKLFVIKYYHSKLVFCDLRNLFYQWINILIRYSHYPITSKYRQQHLLGENQTNLIGYL